MDWQQYRGGHRWRLTEAGIEVEGEGRLRTAGEPQTVSALLSDFGLAFEQAAHAFGLDVASLVALAAIESARLPNSIHRAPKSVRQEPRYVNDVVSPQQISAGLMQTLLSTAKFVANWCGYRKEQITREFLFDPLHSIMCGAAYVRSGWWQHHGDPVLLQAAYNAGGVYHSDKNRWQLMTYCARRTDDFIEFYNDCCAVQQ